MQNFHLLKKELPEERRKNPCFAGRGEITKNQMLLKDVKYIQLKKGFDNVLYLPEIISSITCGKYLYSS